jgi:hypothetical protein
MGHCGVLTEEKLDEVGARLEHTLQKSLRCLAQEAHLSKLLVVTAKNLLNLWQHKAAAVHALQPCDLAGRINFCSWFLQSVHDDEVEPCFLPV